MKAILSFGQLRARKNQEILGKRALSLLTTNRFGVTLLGYCIEMPCQFLIYSFPQYNP